MSKSNDVFVSGNRHQMRQAVTGQFLKGGFVGIAAFVGVGVFVYVLYLVGLALPPESKEAADPTPDSFPQLVAEDES